MEPAVCTDVEAQVAEATEVAAQIAALPAVDLVAALASLGPDTRRELLASAARMANHRRARAGAVCGMCGSLDPAETHGDRCPACHVWGHDETQCPLLWVSVVR